MGFRNYIREFLVAILMLFRPSGPCCLSVAEAPFLSLEIREFFGRNFDAFPSFTAMVFSHPGAVF